VRLARQLETRDALRADIAVDARRLHRELRPVADTINAFARQIRRHIEAQRRFIADAAHQLRTPLAMQASQIAYARHRRAHRAPGELLREDMDAMWREMQASNRRLVAVTNKLLLLAQAEHQDAATQRETVDLGAAALRVVEELAALAERRQIDLGFAAPPQPVPVQAQPALLDALLSNLVDNALRYSPEGGHVTITVGREVRRACSRWTTTARASRPRRASGCSSASTAWPATPRAPAWAWPSCARSPPPGAPRCCWTARRARPPACAPRCALHLAPRPTPELQTDRGGRLGGRTPGTWGR
jgi:signal transduction histidine kinase